MTDDKIAIAVQFTALHLLAQLEDWITEHRASVTDLATLTNTVTTITGRSEAEVAAIAEARHKEVIGRSQNRKHK